MLLVNQQHTHAGGLLGTGSTAQVFSGTWAGRDVVVKVLHHDSTCAVQDHAQHIRQLVSLDNANVVRTFCGVTFTSQEAYPGGGAKCGLQPLAAAAAQDVPTRGRDQHSATSTTSSSGQPPKPQQLASTAEGQPTSTQASASSAPAAAASPAAKPPSVLLSFGRQGKSGRRASDLSAFAQLLPAAGMQQSQQQHQSRQRRSSACVVPADAERGVVETWLVQVGSCQRMGFCCCCSACARCAGSWCPGDSSLCLRHSTDCLPTVYLLSVSPPLCVAYIQHRSTVTSTHSAVWRWSTKSQARETSLCLNA